VGAFALLLAGTLPAQAERPLPPTLLRGVVFEGFRAGKSEFEVRAARADVDWVERVAHLHSVQIFFVTPERDSVQVEAERGLVDLDREDFELIGDVRGTTPDGERFRTDRVRFVEQTRELVGDSPVRVERSGLVFVARGMNVDLETRRIRFRGRVRATIEPR
jgi:LPS export ABC transporter protein LptC